MVGVREVGGTMSRIGDRHRLFRRFDVRRWPYYAKRMASAARRWNCGRLRLADKPIARVKLKQFALYVDLRCREVGEHIYVTRTYEPHETQLFRELVQPGMTVCDIGANIGYYTLIGSQCVGAHGRVIAIEPDLHNFSLLRKNVTANGSVNVRLWDVAVGGEPGSARLFRSEFNYGDHRMYEDLAGGRESVDVRVETIDRIMQIEKVDHVDVIKMDVQGYEWHVQQGMQSILRPGGVSAVLTEFWPVGIRGAGGCPDSFVNTFFECGFLAYGIVRGKRLGPLDLAQIYALVPESDEGSADGAFLNLLFKRE